MNLAETLSRVHPLHRLRKSSLFREFTRRFDPMIRWRTPLLARPIFLRLISNAALMADPTHQEDSIRQTFLALLAALPHSDGEARPDFRIVSFEPDAKNLECLRKTSAAWKLPAHQIVPCAVAEAVGRTTFFADEISRATGTLEPAAAAFNATHYGAVPRGIEVETVSLDHLIEQGWAPPLIVKIDVEGAELRVLRGASRLLAERRPILLLEIFGDRVQTFALLEKIGYRCFDSDRKAVVTSETVNIVALSGEFDGPASDALAALGYPMATPAI